MPKVQEDEIYVRIKQGFGSHTRNEETTDDNDKVIKVPVVHRHSDKDAFTLPVSAYERFPEKFNLCNANGSVIEPVMKTVPIQDRVRAATKQTAKKR